MAKKRSADTILDDEVDEPTEFDDIDIDEDIEPDELEDDIDVEIGDDIDDDIDDIDDDEDDAADSDDEDEDSEALDELEAEELDMLTDDEASEVIAVDEVAEMRKIRREQLALDVDPERAGQDEFVCQSCFLVKRISQLADRRNRICRDCA